MHVFELWATRNCAKLLLLFFDSLYPKLGMFITSVYYNIVLCIIRVLSFAKKMFTLLNSSGNTPAENTAFTCWQWKISKLLPWCCSNLTFIFIDIHICSVSYFLWTSMIYFHEIKFICQKLSFYIQIMFTKQESFNKKIYS